MQGQWENEPQTSWAPLPILAGAELREPMVVRGARHLCLIAAAICFISLLLSVYSILAGVFSVPGAEKLLTIAVGFAYLMLCALLLYATSTLSRGLRARDARAWHAQVRYSLLGLLLFPVGTLLHTLILAFWFRPQVKRWFGFKL